jgi:hypothetical protein
MKAVLAIGLALACCTVGMLGVSRSLQGKQPKEVFTGSVAGLGPRGNMLTRGFTLTIEGYTSDADALRFAGILKSKGQDGLLKIISKEKNGTFAIDGELGHDLNTVRVHPTPTGKLYTIVFERWLSMFEVRYGTRSEDYPFTYIELFVDERGMGGTLLPAAKIRFNKEKVIEIENFGAYPAQLMGVQRRE